MANMKFSAKLRISCPGAQIVVRRFAHHPFSTECGGSGSLVVAANSKQHSPTT